MFSTEFAPIYQAILDAKHSSPMLTVSIGGKLLTSTGFQGATITGFSGQHTVGETATGNLNLLLPRVPEVFYNSPVVVQAGYNGMMDTIFSGFVPDWEDAIQNDGNRCNITLRGWSELLKKEERWDLTFQGPIALDAVFVSLCNRVKVPNFIVHSSVDLNGMPIMLGGNTQHEEGKITFTAGTSLLSQFNRLAEPYGYFAFDIPTGHVVLTKMYGKPEDNPMITFVEGVSSFDRAQFIYDSSTLVNYWDVEGITYEEATGGQVPVRSRPASVDPHPGIPGDGFRYKHVNNNDLVRQDQADLARAILELNSSEPQKQAQVHSEAISGLYPCHAVRVISSVASTNELYWVRSVDQTYDNENGGYSATYNLWAGAGEIQPALQERQTFTIQSSAVHLGDETLSHYAHPSPQGSSKQWKVTIPTRATTVNIRGWHHGTNSQVLNGAQTELEVSKWEMRSNPDAEQADSSDNMPVVDEELSSRRPYWDGLRWWKPFGVSFRNVEAGDQWFRLVAGEKSGLDDFEVSGVYLEIYGATEPAGFEEV